MVKPCLLMMRFQKYKMVVNPKKGPVPTSRSATTRLHIFLTGIYVLRY